MIARANARHLQLSPKVILLCKVSSSASGSAWTVPSLFYRRISCHNIYIIYTPNSGLEIAVSVPEREHSRFIGSSEGAGESSEGTGRPPREH